MLSPNAGPGLTLEAVYRAHAGWVARVAARLLGAAADQDDLVHDVFLVVERRLPTFDPSRAQLTTWLWGITANIVRNRRRAAKLRRWWDRGGGKGSNDVVAATTPEDDLARKQASALVYQVLDGMSDKLRTALVLFELEGMSAEEIATLTGQKPGTVWVTLHRARAQFLERARAIREGTPR